VRGASGACSSPKGEKRRGNVVRGLRQRDPSVFCSPGRETSDVCPFMFPDGIDRQGVESQVALAASTAASTPGPDKAGGRRAPSWYPARAVGTSHARRTRPVVKWGRVYS
jgi:hypothetical protein